MSLVHFEAFMALCAELAVLRGQKKEEHFFLSRLTRYEKCHTGRWSHGALGVKPLAVGRYGGLPESDEVACVPKSPPFP